jgi:hypothetical protein
VAIIASEMAGEDNSRPDPRKDDFELPRPARLTPFDEVKQALRLNEFVSE